jgi:hypothetical protein
MPVMNVPNQQPDQTLMQLAQFLEQQKIRKQNEGRFQLQTLMELGGSPDPGAIESISKNLGMDPSILTSVMKTKGSFTSGDTDESAIPVTSKYFPSRAERELEVIKPRVKAEAEAQAEAEPVTTGAEIKKREALRPVLKGEKQDALDLEFAAKQKELDMQYEKAIKVSKNITIPEHKQMSFDTLANEKELATQRLANEKDLAKYQRGLQGTPTPKEKAEIEMYGAHSQYYKDMGEYNKTIRGQLGTQNAANKEFVNTLKTHTEFMKNNSSKFYDKGKNGKLTPHEYDPGSQEEKDFITSMDSAGIKYQKSTAPHWIGKNKDVFIPVAPEVPKQVAGTGVEGTMDIKSFTDKNVTLGNGKVLMRNPDGSVTINGKNYQVEED